MTSYRPGRRSSTIRPRVSASRCSTTQLDIKFALGIIERVDRLDQVRDDPRLAIKRHHDSIVRQLIISEFLEDTPPGSAGDRRHRPKRDGGRENEPENRCRNSLQGVEVGNAEDQRQRRKRSGGSDLQSGHSLPCGEAPGQTAKSDIEEVRAVAGRPPDLQTAAARSRRTTRSGSFRNASLRSAAGRTWREAR